MRNVACASTMSLYCPALSPQRLLMPARVLAWAAHTTIVHLSGPVSIPDDRERRPKHCHDEDRAQEI
jgi:hypothetical protein